MQGKAIINALNAVQINHKNRWRQLLGNNLSIALQKLQIQSRRLFLKLAIFQDIEATRSRQLGAKRFTSQGKADNFPSKELPLP